VDLARVGIFGWSYGGYLSAMAVCRAPYQALFRCAVAGAPVTSWDGYDTHYTERYMGLPQVRPVPWGRGRLVGVVTALTAIAMKIHLQTIASPPVTITINALPQENPEGYKGSAVTTHAATMPAGGRGRLLLVHGLIDENVHFRHTARLVNALIRQVVPALLSSPPRHPLSIPSNERHTALLPCASHISSSLIATAALRPCGSASGTTWCCFPASDMPRTATTTACTWRSA